MLSWWVDGEIIYDLLKAGADANLPTNNELGARPFHLAALYTQNEAILCLLILYGADINLPDRWGTMPLSHVPTQKIRTIHNALVRLYEMGLKHSVSVPQTAHSSQAPYQQNTVPFRSSFTEPGACSIPARDAGAEGEFSLLSDDSGFLEEILLTFLLSLVR